MVNSNFNEEGIYRPDELVELGIEYSSLFQMTRYLGLICDYYGLVENEPIHPYIMTEQRAELLRKFCKDFNCNGITINDTKVGHLVPSDIISLKMMTTL